MDNWIVGFFALYVRLKANPQKRLLFVDHSFVFYNHWPLTDCFLQSTTIKCLCFCFFLSCSFVNWILNLSYLFNVQDKVIHLGHPMAIPKEGLLPATHHPLIPQAVHQAQGLIGQGTHQEAGHLLPHQVMPMVGLDGHSHLPVTALGRRTLEVKVGPLLHQLEVRLINLSRTQTSFRYYICCLIVTLTCFDHYLILPTSCSQSGTVKSW